MRPWIKRGLFGLFGATILLGGLSACAHRYEHGWPMSAEDAAKMRGKIVDRVSAKLDLDAGQKAKLEVLADRLQAQRAAVRGAADPRTEVQALVAGDKFDRSKAQALLDGKLTAVTKGSPEVIAALGDFYDSLNPAQQQKVREFMQRGRGGWHRG